MSDAAIWILAGSLYFLGYCVSAVLLTIYAFPISAEKIDASSVAAGVMWAIFWPVALPFIVPGLIVFWVARKLRPAI